jgi:hypothetical protein
VLGVEGGFESDPQIGRGGRRIGVGCHEDAVSIGVVDGQPAQPDLVADALGVGVAAGQTEGAPLRHPRDPVVAEQQAVDGDLVLVDRLSDEGDRVLELAAVGLLHVVDDGGQGGVPGVGEQPTASEREAPGDDGAEQDDRQQGLAHDLAATLLLLLLGAHLRCP